MPKYIIEQRKLKSEIVAGTIPQQFLASVNNLRHIIHIHLLVGLLYVFGIFDNPLIIESKDRHVVCQN